MPAFKWAKYCLASAFLFCVASAAQAACTNASLIGSYGIQEQGMHDEAAGFVEFRSIGTLRFDGHGNGLKNETLWFSDRSINPVTDTVIYSVQPDCSFTFSYVESGETFQGVIVNGGLKVLYMETSGDIIRSGQAERIRGTN
jgi:hypothetical protein